MMNINWSLVILLSILATPGVIVVIPRLIGLLLESHSQRLQQRISQIVIAQILLMVFLMSLVGTILSAQTSFGAPFLQTLLEGQFQFNLLVHQFLPIFKITAINLIGFLILYDGLLFRYFDPQTQQTLNKIRSKIGLNGMLLYGITEEILARYGLMNVLGLFAFYFFSQHHTIASWNAVLVSGILYSLAQPPAYIAAGCSKNRWFMLAIVLLYLWQSIFFGYIFWHYGILLAIISHLLFHLFWRLYDLRFRTS